MRKKRQHPRSAVARQTAGITLDHAAPLYDWLAPLMTLGTEQRLHRQIVKRLAAENPRKVLDIGCGTGTLTRQVYDALPAGDDLDICGLDAAEKMIEVARKKAGSRPGLRFEAALAEELPVPDASMDCVLSTFFFHHLNYDLKRKSLTECWRALRPGGQLLILDVDIPYSLFGKICAWSGYWLFRQPEIAENIHGRLREALRVSPWGVEWQIASRHSGYLSLFIMQKPQENTP